MKKPNPFTKRNAEAEKALRRRHVPEDIKALMDPKIVARKGNSRRVRRSRTRTAPSRSCRSVACTTMLRIRPAVSTSRCRFLPLTFLPAS